MNDIRRLDHVWRYSSIPVIHAENVAQHSFYVTIYAVLIHQQLKPDEPELLTPIMLAAMTHDMIEMKTGDIVRTFKYLTPELKQEIDRAEDILIDKLDPVTKSLFNLTKNQAEGCNNDTCIYIKDVVKAADFLSLFQYMRVEALKGNMDIIPFYNRMILDIAKMWNDASKSNNLLKDFYCFLNHTTRMVSHNCFPNHLKEMMDREI